MKKNSPELVQRRYQILSISYFPLQIRSYYAAGIANVDITLKGQILVMDKPELSMG